MSLWVPYFGAGPFKIETSNQNSTRPNRKYISSASKPYQELLHWIRIEGVMIDQSWDVVRHFCPASLVMCVLARTVLCQTVGVQQVSKFMVKNLYEGSFNSKNVEHQSCSLKCPLQHWCWDFLHMINHERVIEDQSE